MPNLTIDTVEINLDAIRTRWGLAPTQPRKMHPESSSLEQVVERLKNESIRLQKVVARQKALLNAKRVFYRKRIQNTVAQCVISLLVPVKNRTTRAHRKTSKSVIGNLSSGKSDGSDPDPDRKTRQIYTSSLYNFLFIALLTFLLSIANFANISTCEVAK